MKWCVINNSYNNQSECDEWIPEDQRVLLRNNVPIIINMNTEHESNKRRPEDDQKVLIRSIVTIIIFIPNQYEINKWAPEEDQNVLIRNIVFIAISMNNLYESGR